MIVLESTEKELKIINEIDKDLNVTQREISKKSGMSLGMTNIILRKLINKGYVKIRQLNKNKVQYFLTPKGFTEKARKSYHYTLKTMEILKEMKLKIQNFILREHRKGQKKFIIYGKGEIAWLTEISLRDLKIRGLVYKTISGNKKISLQDRDSLILLVNPNKKENGKGINIVDIL